VVRRGKVGFILHQGEYAIEPQFDRGSHFSEGVAAVTREGKYGYISAIGRFVIPPRFDSAEPFQEGLAAVQDGNTGRWGFVDKTGEFVIPAAYESVTGFNGGLAAVRLSAESDPSWGYIDKSGDIAFPQRFASAVGFRDGVASVRMISDSESRETVGLCSMAEPNAEWVFIDREGKRINTIGFQQVGEFRGGFCAVRSNGKWGYVDRSGKLRILPGFDEARPFYEGRAVVGIRDARGRMAYGYIDGDGDYVFEPRAGLLEVSHFSEGLAAVTVPRTWLERISPLD
jgi:hypothetical protein